MTFEVVYPHKGGRRVRDCGGRAWAIKLYNRPYGVVGFLTETTGSRAGLIAKIERPGFVNGRIEVMVVR